MSPVRSAGDVSDAGAADDVVSTVLNVHGDYDLERTVGVGEVDQEAVKSRFQQQQESCRVKKQRVPASLLEVFISATELNEDPVASATKARKDNVANAGVTVADALKRLREETGSDKVPLSKITNAK